MEEEEGLEGLLSLGKQIILFPNEGEDVEMIYNNNNSPNSKSNIVNNIQSVKKENSPEIVDLTNLVDDDELCEIEAPSKKRCATHIRISIFIYTQQKIEQFKNMGNYANNYLMYYSMDPTMNMRIYTEKSKHQPEKWPLIPLARKQSQNSFPVSLLVNDNHHNNNHHNNNNNNNLKNILNNNKENNNNMGFSITLPPLRNLNQNSSENGKIFESNVQKGLHHFHSSF